MCWQWYPLIYRFLLSQPHSFSSESDMRKSSSEDGFDEDSKNGKSSEISTVSYIIKSLNHRLRVRWFVDVNRKHLGDVVMLLLSLFFRVVWINLKKEQYLNCLTCNRWISCQSYIEPVNASIATLSKKLYFLYPGLCGSWNTSKHSLISRMASVVINLEWVSKKQLLNIEACFYWQAAGFDLCIDRLTMLPSNR